ncbi:LysR family transcriptional regulator ArgP [Roseibium suaedae]|uniref:LysR family transcriptional regulator, chromosome initiation inhibitor n=1 Tax=Roseibium suaedae TaxID=735517 RepID=A0A1M7HET0_9HYPH|nr:LysR family transcriptional regulator ArgP [Roseibium suaedae]SHM26996.1 LysR family transcriptional regulator, chromosome initiation inhibitor [Roseibium suaedae]
MKLDPGQLKAFSAVLRTGGFDKAAQALGVTQSAISQRIRLLEERLGCSLIIRGQPCLPTGAGKRLQRHAEDLELLEQSLKADIGLEDLSGPWPTIRIAVNADSLATWFIEALAQCEGLLFDIIIDDQDHSADLLRRGEVRAAVSSDPSPVQGCDCSALGALRYRATASPTYMAKWFGEGVKPDAILKAPMLTYSAKDGLQGNWIRQVFGVDLVPPTHWMASTHAFVDAASAGLGWGMNPEPLVRRHLEEGTLVELCPEQPYDVSLFWHVSRSADRFLAPLTQAVRSCAASVLVRP